MKRYHAFVGHTYYPAPAWSSWAGSADSEAAAESKAARLLGEIDGDWWQVVDMESEVVVAGHGEGFAGMCGLLSAAPAELEQIAQNTACTLRAR